MTYISFEMHLTLIMVYILVRMCMALHVPFETLIMVYILIRMNVAFHLPFRTLAIAYIPFKTCLDQDMVNILVKMHFTHNNILDVSFETQTKIHRAFQIMENLFHYNLM